MINVNLKVVTVKSILYFVQFVCLINNLCNAIREEFGCDECFFRLFKGNFSFYAVTLLIEYSSVFYLLLGHLCSGILWFTSDSAL